MNLRDQVESMLPNWQSWYPTVFDAAVDLGILRARVCPPGSLLLSQRHASIYNEAVQAFREQWSAVEQEELQPEQSTREPHGGDDTHSESERGRRNESDTNGDARLKMRDERETEPDSFASRVTRLALRLPREE